MTVMETTPASNLAALWSRRSLKEQGPKGGSPIFSFFLSCGSKSLSDYLLCQHRKILLAKMLIITLQIGNGIRINKGEMTVIMVVLMGPACIIKGRIQRNNSDPLGCAAALF